MSFTLTNSFTALPYSSAQTTVGQGTFLIELKSTGDPTAIWVRSTGTSNNLTRRVQAYVVVRNFNTWNNVLFAGTGQSGNAIGGNVDIRGSVHILGGSLTSSDLAMDLDGGASVGNNYTGIPVALSSRIPPIPTVNFDGEMVQSLSGEVRIKKGKLGLRGTSTAGQTNVPGNTVKETMDGMFVTDGYGGNQGSANVYSDNGTSSSYDLGNSVGFSLFNQAYKDRRDGLSYSNYNTFVTTKGLNGGASLQTINPKQPGGTPSFCWPVPASCGTPDANGNSIQWDNSVGVKTLTVQGVVYANGDIDFGNKSADMYFKGNGTVVALGSSSDISIHGNFLTQTGRFFPTQDVIGFVAEDKVEIATGGGESQKKVMGAFYGQNEIEVDKQASIAGSLNSKHFQMDQVPSIYQVPELVNHLPPGLIGDQDIYVILVRSWQEV